MPALVLLAQLAPPSLAPGTLLWAAFFGALGLSLGAGLLLAARRRPAAAPLAAPLAAPGAAPLAALPADRIPPGRLGAEQLDALLAGPLSNHRVVLLGPAHPGTIACLAVAPLPRELVAAVERLAVVAGPPVALVVADPGRLDRPVGRDPVDALAALVDGRFPLWVVDGPPDWPGLA